MDVVLQTFPEPLIGLELSGNAQLRGADLNALALGTSNLASIVLHDVLPRPACELLASELSLLTARSYDGAASAELGVALGSSHWDARYNDLGSGQPNSAANWQAYFEGVAKTDAQRRELSIRTLGYDIEDVIVGVLMMAIVNVGIARHPRLGRRMEAGVFRSGAAGVHRDYAKDDIGLSAIGHIGVVLPLSTGPSPRQRVWDHFWEADEIGNYGYSIPEHVPHIDVPTPIGSLCLLSARRSHAVIDSPNRITYAFHLALLDDGRWVYYA